MKAVSVFLTFVILENWVSQLQADQLQLLRNPKIAYVERRQLRLGNYNYDSKWKPKDCDYDYDPGFTRQHDIALFNATPSAHDLTQKYQVMYFPKETSMPGRSTLVSSPFLFYKMLLPRPQHHGNGLENLANTGAHLFPTEAPDMPDMTTIAPTMNMMPDMTVTMAPTAMPANIANMVPPAMTRYNRPRKYSHSRNVRYPQINRMQNYDFFNENFAQLEYLQNNPQNVDIRLLVEQTPLYRLLPQYKQKLSSADDKKYLPIKPYQLPRRSNIELNTLEPPFQASPFMGYMPESRARNTPKFIPLQNFDEH